MTQRNIHSPFQTTIPTGSVAGHVTLATTVLVLITLLITVLTGAGFGHV